MLGALAKRLFGTVNDRTLKRLDGEIAAINELEPSLEALSDEELRGRTDQFRARIANGETVEDVYKRQVDRSVCYGSGSRKTDIGATPL